MRAKPHARWIAALTGILVCSWITGCGGGGDGSQPPDRSNSVANPTPTGGTGNVPSPTSGAAQLGSCQAFPSDAAFNTRVDTLLPHASSDAWINAIGRTVPMHADWGLSENQSNWSSYFGIPINLIDSSASSSGTWPVVSFNITDPRAGNGNGVPEESDCASSHRGLPQRPCSGVPPGSRLFPYPPSNQVKAEYGACNDAQICGDRHVLVVDQSTCTLWESYYTYLVAGQWFAYSTAAWNLNQSDLRPDTWTSGDAAGLPIAPLLARFGEANLGTVNHTLRVTFRDSVLERTYIWPARHAAGQTTPGGIPFGAVLRLKSTFSIPSQWTTQAQAVARAMQRHGLYVADIGSDFFVQGEPNVNWDSRTLSQLSTITLTQMEFVDTTTWRLRSGWSPSSLRVPAANN